MVEHEMLRILLIEDNPGDALLIRQMLGESSAKVGALTCVARLAAGVEHLATEPVDVVLLDLSLPDSAGIETVVRARQAAANTPIVVLTGLDNQGIGVEILRAGGQDYLTKGLVEPEHLARAIRHAIERFRLSRALGASEARLHAIIDHNVDAIIILDHKRRMLFANKSAELLFGRSVSAMGGEAFDIPVSSETVEIEVDRPDGSQAVAEVRSVPFEWEEQPARLVSLCDVSARVELESQLRQSQKMEAVGRLACGIAHEFNNLLTVINGYSEMLIDEAQKHRNGCLELDTILKAGKRAAVLTQQLLAFSRRQFLQPEPLMLNQVAETVAQMLQVVLPETIELELDLAADAGRAQLDRGQVEQALLNLALNARDAMPRGGSLVVRTQSWRAPRPFAVWGGEGQPGDYVSLTVRDTGTGMCAEVLRHLFEPFFTTKGLAAGTGLGMPMVYGLVQQSGGCVRVTSELGVGTAVELLFPRILDRTQAIRETPSTDLPQGRGVVLLVEDSEIVRAYQERALSMLGYSVITAVDGLAALEYLANAREPVDLILSDIIMPNMSGVELVRRAQEAQPDLKALLMSGYDEEHLGAAGRPADVPILAKPFTVADLAQAVLRQLALRPVAE